MATDATAIEQCFRRDIDSAASVRCLNANLSPFLSGSYDLYNVRLLGEDIVLAWPKDMESNHQGLLKRVSALSRALNRPVSLYLPQMTRRQRRLLIENRQGFITTAGDYYLPQLALILSSDTAKPIDVVRPFTPIQQAVFLYCLYADGAVIEHESVKNSIGASSGSVSSALSELTRLGLLECCIGGKTGRKKTYRVRDEENYFHEGLKYFQSPVSEVIEAPLSIVKDDWLKSGLSALADVSDLLPPKFPEYAISKAQAKAIELNPSESSSHCVAKVLKYDPLLFATRGRVDFATMLLTIGEYDDERISLALRQALGGQKWYRG